MREIYLDYNASTPIDPVVADAMRPLLEDAFGNPSSVHWAGTPAKTALENARCDVAGLLGCSPDEVIFTSGGSESNNLALKGVFFALRDKGNHIVTSAIEHPATITTCKFLERLGAEVTYLPVDQHGLVDPNDLRRELTPKTILISIMHANNEVGTIEPIEEISRIAREHAALLHTDAAQSVGKIATNVNVLGVDLLSMAGHKFYAPKGIGALYVRPGTPLEPLIHGADHEAGRRAGTESALLAAALGAASKLARDLRPMNRVRGLRDHFWQELHARFADCIVLNGHHEYRLPNTLNIAFPNCVGADILAELDGVAASTGSACHSGRAELSPVLKAMGIRPEVGMGAIRFSLGRYTAIEDIDAVIDRLTYVFAGGSRSKAKLAGC
jgi:cysteine desulfurase